MECREFVVNALQLEAYLTREALQALVHTIMFNRALNMVEPVPVYSELFDATYVRCNDEVLRRDVEQHVTQFYDALVEQRAQRQFVISLFQTVSERSWFSRNERKVVWEKWIIPVMPVVEARESTEHSRRQAAAEQSVKEALVQIADIVATQRSHIPPGTESRYDFSSQSGVPATPTYTIGNVFRRIINTEAR